MFRVGIVGAENSHSRAIAKTLNIDKAVPGFRVVSIWGETKAFAEGSAEAGAIPTIVRWPADMVGDVDGVMIDHRHAKHHLAAAEPFLAAKIPMFIDKPFCFRLAKGKDFLARARRRRVPVTSFSTIPLSKDFRAFKKVVAKASDPLAVTSFGPCDIESPHGGIFFYAVHQVDSLLDLFGRKVEAVQISRKPGNTGAAATLYWKGGLIGTMHCVVGYNVGFQFSIATDGGNVSAKMEGDASPYLSGAKLFCKMFKTGVEPIDHKDILARIAVLEALAKSVKTGKLTKVGKV